jgi:hypothetical protein
MTCTQQQYLEILLNDMGYADRKQRNGYLSRMVGRAVRYLDDLSTSEKSKLIHVLKAQKEVHEGQTV